MKEPDEAHHRCNHVTTLPPVLVVHESLIELLHGGAQHPRHALHVVRKPVQIPVMRVCLGVNVRGDLFEHGDAVRHEPDRGVVVALQRLRVLLLPSGPALSRVVEHAASLALASLAVLVNGCSNDATQRSQQQLQHERGLQQH
eukprot:CAMPEP_0197599756 /NCGR_PEP_ID=MMETSP1326-20131121/32022_1 /TAXON_ID=1155430 /ORGANISM="Genus nov. species nov., Strain RCC2288" /LENGTH=142 /DNA_ID=CAMNT_0043166769 /DNA_START=355 /DNA_END=783 /DNA_ORIENTATION=+